MPHVSTFSYCKIFPSIGIARLGNSPTGFFIGPETPRLSVDANGSFKDAEGRVKRQAARFRIYAFNAEGKPVAELTADHPDVTSIVWKVTLANRKAEWHRFEGTGALSTVLAGGSDAPAKRNASLEGDKRKALMIGPATAQVSGAGQQSKPLEGRFLDKPTSVQLGQLRTDRRGRLLVLGGLGESATVAPDNPLRSFANNDSWHDDTSDGPVTAEVTLTDGTQARVAESRLGHLHAARVLAAHPQRRHSLRRDDGGNSYGTRSPGRKRSSARRPRLTPSRSPAISSRCSSA